MYQIINGHIEINHISVRAYIPIELTGTKKKKSKTYIGWIDTGATHTMICKKVLTDLEFLKEGETTATLANGTVTKSDLYLVKFKISGTHDDSKLIDTLHVTLSEKELIGYNLLIGLDILQHGKFIYDGQKQAYSLSFNK
jgi:predicted aspartyl protease